jgi:hypothetical protein
MDDRLVTKLVLDNFESVPKTVFSPSVGGTPLCNKNGYA